MTTHSEVASTTGYVTDSSRSPKLLAYRLEAYLDYYRPCFSIELTHLV